MFIISISISKSITSKIIFEDEFEFFNKSKWIDYCPSTKYYGNSGRDILFNGTQPKHRNFNETKCPTIITHKIVYGTIVLSVRIPQNFTAFTSMFTKESFIFNSSRVIFEIRAIGVFAQNLIYKTNRSENLRIISRTLVLTAIQES